MKAYLVRSNVLMKVAPRSVSAKIYFERGTKVQRYKVVQRNCGSKGVLRPRVFTGEIFRFPVTEISRGGRGVREKADRLEDASSSHMRIRILSGHGGCECDKVPSRIR